MRRALVLLLVTGCGNVTPVVDAGPQRACAALGGTCGAVSGCTRGSGYLAAASDCGASLACCVPLSACGNTPEFECCSATATYRPTCEGGALKCAIGTVRCDTVVDAGRDAGFDAGTDAGTDAGVRDAGTDAGNDAGTSDAGDDAGADAGADGGVAACVALCPPGCAAPGSVCYSDGHEYCSACVAGCNGAQVVTCGG